MILFEQSVVSTFEYWLSLLGTSTTFFLATVALLLALGGFPMDECCVSINKEPGFDLLYMKSVMIELLL